MPFFEGAYDFDISGGKFYDVKGDMNSYRVDNSVNVNGDNNRTTIAPNHSRVDNRSFEVGYNYYTQGQIPSPHHAHHDIHGNYPLAIEQTPRQGSAQVDQLAHQWANMRIRSQDEQYRLPQQQAYGSDARRIDAYPYDPSGNINSVFPHGNAPPPQALRSPTQHPHAQYPPHHPHNPHHRAQTVPIPNHAGGFDAFNAPSQLLTQFDPTHPHPMGNPMHPLPPPALHQPPHSRSPPEPIPGTNHDNASADSLVNPPERDNISSLPGNSRSATLPSAHPSAPYAAPPIPGTFNTALQNNHPILAAPANNAPLSLAIPTIIEPPPVSLTQSLGQMPSPSQQHPIQQNLSPISPPSLASVPSSATSSINQDVPALSGTTLDKKKKRWSSMLREKMGLKKSKKTSPHRDTVG